MLFSKFVVIKCETLAILSNVFFKAIILSSVSVFSV